MRLYHLKIMIWDPMFLADIWQRDIQGHLNYVCLSVRSNHDYVQMATNIAHRVVLPIRRSILKMDYIGPQDLVPPI